jgi:hypothetical protein
LGWTNQVLDEDPDLYKHDYQEPASCVQITNLRGSRRYLILLTRSYR